MSCMEIFSVSLCFCHLYKLYEKSPDCCSMLKINYLRFLRINVILVSLEIEEKHPETQMNVNYFFNLPFLCIFASEFTIRI